MTIGGAIAELQSLINADDVPFYYKGGIKKVIETISMELPPADTEQGCDGCRYDTRTPQKQCLRCKRYWRDSYERKDGDTE